MTEKQHRFMRAIHTELNMRRRAALGTKFGFGHFREVIQETQAAREAVQHEVQEHQLNGVDAWQLGPLFPTNADYASMEEMENYREPLPTFHRKKGRK